MSHALPERVFVNGTLVPRDQVRMGVPTNLYGTFRPIQPVPASGPVVKLPGLGTYTVRFTIAPTTASTCTGRPYRPPDTVVAWTPTPYAACSRTSRPR